MYVFYAITFQNIIYLCRTISINPTVFLIFKLIQTKYKLGIEGRLVHFVITKVTQTTIMRAKIISFSRTCGHYINRLPKHTISIFFCMKNKIFRKITSGVYKYEAILFKRLCRSIFLIAGN